MVIVSPLRLWYTPEGDVVPDGDDRARTLIVGDDCEISEEELRAAGIDPEALLAGSLVVNGVAYAPEAAPEADKKGAK